MNYADRLKQETTGIGTGNLTLGAAPAGFRTLASVYASSEKFFYVVQDAVSGQWEAGLGYVIGGALVRETPLEGSSATPVSFGAGTKQVFVGHPAALSKEIHTAIFGDGNDGDLVISAGTTTLSGSKNYRNLTISGTGKLVTGCYVVRVCGVLDLSLAPTDGINNNGFDGTAATADAGGSGAFYPGIGGTGSPLGGWQLGGTNGGSGGTGVGAQATAATSATPALGGPSGASGAGGTGNGGGTAGGAARAATAAAGADTVGMLDTLLGADASGVATLFRGGGSGSGGSAGGGDGANKAGGGGGGGGAGLPMDLRAFCLKVTGATTSVICSRGGRGGNGGTPAAGNCGGGGGGGGAGGGYVRLVYGFCIGSRSQLVNCQGGGGGNGGAKTGTGVVGSGGNGGTGGRISIFNVGTGQAGLTRTEVVGSAGSAAAADVGGNGGSCYGDV